MDKQPEKHKKYKKQKIDTYVSAEDIRRLKAVCKKSGMSTYSLLQYLIYCFLRVADPENDSIIEPVPEEIREMFISPREYRRLKRGLKKHTTPKLEIQLLVPFDEYKAKKPKRAIITKNSIALSDEIEEVFAEHSEWETNNYSFGSHKDMIMKKKPDQRKIKTANDIQ